MVTATNLALQEKWNGKPRKVEHLHSRQRTADVTANYQNFRLTKGRRPYDQPVQDREVEGTTALQHWRPRVGEGTAMASMETEPVQGVRPLQERSEARPWVRYWARMIDCWTATLMLP